VQGRTGIERKWARNSKIWRRRSGTTRMTGKTGKAYVSATTASGRLVRAPNWTDGLGVARRRGDGGGVRRCGGGGGGCRVGGRLQLYYDDRYQTKLKPNDYNIIRDDEHAYVIPIRLTDVAPSVAVMSLLHQRFSEWI